MLLYLAALLLGLLPFWLVYLSRQHGRMGRMVNLLPGPKALPIFGNLLQLHVTSVRINELLREWGKIYYPVYKIWFGNTPLIHIRHPDDLEILFVSTKHIEKKFIYNQLYPWLRTGLLTSNGAKWQARRKILSPAFHFNILKKYMDITNEQAEKAVLELRKEKEVKIELLRFCSTYTLNIICESAMGVSLDGNSDKEESLKYRDAVYSMGDILVYRVIRPYILDCMIPFMPKLNKQITETITNMNNFINKIISERREYHKSTNYNLIKELQDDKEIEPENIYIGKKKRLAMLDLLLDAERKNLIDDEGIKEEVATFIFEGHDTTAMAMLFTLVLLAENEEAQSKVRSEIEGVLNQKNGKMETSDLQGMVYLERCIKESMRLFPSVPMIARHMTEDLQLKHCKAPKGSDILLHIIDVHMDPQFWPEPEKFDPDRFLPDQIKQRHTFSYVPFSAGSRNCIGQKFAMLELKSLLVRLLHNFYLKPIDHSRDIKIMTDVIIRPSQPVYIKFIRIDRQTTL